MASDKKITALSALEPGLRDEVVDIPVSAEVFLQCRFISFGYIAANLIDRRFVSLINQHRKTVTEEFESGKRSNDMVEAIKATAEYMKSLSDAELRQMCENSDRLRLDEIKDDSGNLRFARRVSGSYADLDHDQLAERVEKEIVAECLLGIEMPQWAEYMPEWYGISDEEAKKMSEDDRRFRQRQMVDVEQSRRRDQALTLPTARLYARLDSASAQTVARDEANSWMAVLRLWAACRTAEDREKHYFPISGITTLQDALEAPKRVYTEVLKLLHEDEMLLAQFIRAYNQYSNKEELLGKALDDAARDPFRAELRAPSGEDTSALILDTLSGDAGDNSTVDSEVNALDGSG
jgi:hypothetical protein